MRFHIAAAVVAVASLFSGVVADNQQTSVATLTLTRTVQRVVQTVTSTKCSSTLQTAAASASYGSGSVNGTVVSPALTSTSAPVRATGAAGALNVEYFGMAAAAGFVGYFAL